MASCRHLANAKALTQIQAFHTALPAILLAVVLFKFEMKNYTEFREQHTTTLITAVYFYS